MPRRQKTGTVVSDKMDKTRVVTIVERTRHARYKKIHIETTRFKIHDPENVSQVGDVVEIVESRHISKDKCWTLKRVVKHQEEVIV